MQFPVCQNCDIFHSVSTVLAGWSADSPNMASERMRGVTANRTQLCADEGLTTGPRTQLSVMSLRFLLPPLICNCLFLTHGMFLISWYCRDSRILLHCFACTVKGSLITAGYPLEVIEKLPGSGNKREYKTKWSNCEPPEPDPSPASLDFPWQLPWLQDRGLDRVERSRGPL